MGRERNHPIGFVSGEISDDPSASALLWCESLLT
jgi:hypothetical protein